MIHDARGSTWRRWDLHVHTPASVSSEFGPPDDDKTWARYAASLASEADKRKIEVIALSDYFTVDGYHQLIARGFYKPDANVILVEGNETRLLVLPGVEFRLSQITGEGHAVNLHVIFDPERVSVERIRSEVLERVELDPPHGDQSLTASKHHLLALGKSVKMGKVPNLSEDLSDLPADKRDDLWATALSSAGVSLQALQKVLGCLDASVPGGRSYLLAVAGSGHGGLHELPWEGHAGTIRQSILRAADLVFSSNENDRSFFLGERDDTPLEEIQERFGRPKPCVWGSDSKTFDTLLHPSAGNTSRYTWVKADRSFEGLKQLVYEPADRVRVQDEHPDERPWNSIIDSVRFLDDAKTGLVSEEWIPLSPSLTTVIGGKSSGKSLLLHFIAKSIDPQQVRERTDSSKPYDLLEQDLGFEVRWKNGDVQSLNGAEVAPSRITYLPQNYINQLAEPDSQSQLEEVIMRLLKEKEQFTAADNARLTAIERHRSVISQQLQRLFELRRQISDVRERMADLGSRSAIEAEIERLEEEQASIRAASGMTVDEEKAFSKLRHKNSDLSSTLHSFETERSEVDAFLALISSLKMHVEAEILDSSVQLDNSEDESRPTRVIKLFDRLRTEWDTATRSLLEAAKETQTTIEADIAQVKIDQEQVAMELEPFESKLEGRTRAEALAEAQTKHKESLGQYAKEERRKDRLEDRLEEGRKRLVGAYRDIYKAVTDLINEHLDGGEVEIGADVRLTAEVRFDKDAFWEQLQQGIDGRARIDYLSGITQRNDEYEYSDIDSLCDDINALLAELTAQDDDTRLKLKKSYSPLDVATAVVRDHFGLKLSLKHAGDDIRRMSPGKRGMILLRLLLEKSDATHPILIDQPEDNLDNRTVFSQLRAAVRNRKTARQIILVSHNANLVVSTDSECVLVAQQYGLGEVPKGLTQFQYRGGSLEHSYPRVDADDVLDSQGTREHVCEILEGGERAFLDRQEKYEFHP